MAAIPLAPRQLPPWSGPPPEPVGPSRKMLHAKEAFPFQDAQAKNPNLFPPVCIRSHWDPEQIIRRTLPSQQVGTPLDPRPYTRVCLQYVTSQEFEDAPRPSDDVVYPSGGTVYPPSRYREAVDNESLLRRLDRPLGTCERNQYIAPRSGDMYRQNVLVPDRLPQDKFVQELAFPMACMRDGPYDCVQEVQTAAWARSPRLFNNTTKQDRYAVKRPDLVKVKGTPGPIPTSLQSLS
jgi:hypothetical protein